MRTRVVPFEPAHYLAAVQDRTLPWLDAGSVAEQYYRSSRAVTLLADDQVLGCGGIAYLLPQTGEAWLVVTACGQRHPFTVGRVIVRELRALLRSRPLRRLQASCVEGHAVAYNLLRHLGFEVESLMPEYGPNGETFVRMVCFPGATR